MIRKLWPAFLWAFFILIITGMPGRYVPEVLSFWDWLSVDKIVHVGVFALLSFLILNGLLQQYIESKTRYLFVLGAVGSSLAYGLLTEVLQATVFIGRDGNAFDFLADSLGAFGGWVMFVILHRKKINSHAESNTD